MIHSLVRQCDSQLQIFLLLVNCCVLDWIMYILQIWTVMIPTRIKQLHYRKLKAPVRTLHGYIWAFQCIQHSFVEAPTSKCPWLSTHSHKPQHKCNINLFRHCHHDPTFSRCSLFGTCWVSKAIKPSKRSELYLMVKVLRDIITYPGFKTKLELIEHIPRVPWQYHPWPCLFLEASIFFEVQPLATHKL